MAKKEKKEEIKTSDSEVKIKKCKKTVSKEHIWVKQQFSADVSLPICVACGLVNDADVVRE